MHFHFWSFNGIYTEIFSYLKLFHWGLQWVYTCVTLEGPNGRLGCGILADVKINHMYDN